MLFAAKQLLRRYTPPTCTLELWVTRSRFRPFLTPDHPQDWQFELRFDDPRMPEDQQIDLQGDRQQLDHLDEILGDYLQNFLQETRRLWTSSSAEENSSGKVGLVEPPAVSAIAPTQPFFRAQGLLSHELHGGALTEAALPAIVTLSTSQLFDLSHALDDYQRDRTQILHPKPSSAQPSRGLILAGIAIALGLLGLILGQERWSQMLTPRAAINAQKNPSPTQSSPYVNAIPPVPLPPLQSIPSPRLASVLIHRDPLPLPSPATPGDPLSRSAISDLPVSGLRVLPPIPLAPPAPPLPPGATSTVGLNPLDSGILNIPAVSPEKDAKVSPLAKLPPPPPLFASRSNSANSAIALPGEPESLPAQNRTIARQAPPAQTRLLDPIPQVGEVRAYFQKRWQKPPDLNQSLEYRLSIKPNGSLAQIIPLGKAAAIYQPQVGMPAVGEVFVSPLPQQSDQTIRLVLDLEGKVSTFLE